VVGSCASPFAFPLLADTNEESLTLRLSTASVGGCTICPTLSCKGDTIASGAFPLQKAMVDSFAPVVATAEGSRLTAWSSISAEPISTPSKALPRSTSRLSGFKFQKLSNSRDARDVTAKATEIVASKNQGSGYAGLQFEMQGCRQRTSGLLLHRRRPHALGRQREVSTFLPIALVMLVRRSSPSHSPSV
jgi:hypothetical protein